METSRFEAVGHQIRGRLKERFGKLIGDAKLTADGAAERAIGDRQTSAGGQLVPGIDTDRITGVGHQIRGAGEHAVGRFMGDAKLMADGNAEISMGKAQNLAGSVRDEARQASAAGIPGARPTNPKVVMRPPPRSAVLRWLVNDIPYLAMLALAAIGVVLRLPVSYWLIITPVFAAISVCEGWRNFSDRAEKLGLVVRLALDWCALLLAIFLLYNGGVQGVMNANATSLAMMTLLALGSFVAGIQSRTWQICAVGGVLFLAVPGLGWLYQSPLLLLAGACSIVVLASLAWWFVQGRGSDRTSSAAIKPPQPAE